ncbi:MAG: FAD-binding oxidoreductase [Bryobacteraceae bacterium]
MIVEDASGYRGHADLLFTPASEAELLDVLRRATAERVPVTVAGAGTGVTGGRVSSGGWLLSLDRLNRLDIARGHAVVGPAVLLRDLHAAAAATRQFYAPDPTETAASLGGTFATNASGSRSFRYGDTRRHVLRLRVALMDGSVLDVRRGDAIDFPVPALRLPDTTKHTAGYPLRPGMDWIDLFVGSEGTLGVILEAGARLLPAPAELLSGVVFFPDDDRAIDAVEAWRFHDPPRMLEYLDEASLGLLRSRYPEIPAAARAALLIEDDRPADPWHDRIDSSGALLDDSWFGTSAGDRERFRRFRHSLPELVNDRVRRRGFMKFGSDYAVPLDRNRDMLRTYHQVLSRDFAGSFVLFGHIGDAHLHANILPSNDDDCRRAAEAMRELARHAVAFGGTVSAEHGLGKRKAHLLELQYSRHEMEAMMDVKRRLDPKWLLGRDTLFSVPKEFQ